MIQNGKNLKLNNSNSSLPNMSNTIIGWFLNITFDIVERTLVDADYVNTIVKTIKTKGVVQPPRDEDLKILPEGTWSWEWLMLHTLPDVNINTNQYIVYDGKTYKVMGKKDFTKYGYIRYMILESWRTNNL